MTVISEYQQVFFLEDRAQRKDAFLEINRDRFRDEYTIGQGHRLAVSMIREHMIALRDVCMSPTEGVLFRFIDFYGDALLIVGDGERYDVTITCIRDQKAFSVKVQMTREDLMSMGQKIEGSLLAVGLDPWSFWDKGMVLEPLVATKSGALF